MTTPKTLLIVAHCPSPNTETLKNAVLRGASHPDLAQSILPLWKPPLETTAEDVLKADALILGTPENLGYMSGALKDFFDRIYYPVLELKQGLPFAYYIRAGHDGTGTQRAIQTITTGLRWRAVQPPLICKGSYQEEFETQCEELGLYVAAGLDGGLF
ncbi:MAG: flavodoxin family protein [Hahellaceae bacterium]|nr:flavodoxin family protein [Hahellaceae bacterium]